MKRKVFSVFLALMLLVSLSISAFAIEADFPCVVDNAGLLSSDEVEKLNEKIQTMRSELELEIVIVTVYGTGGKNVQEYADDFYDDFGYGYGDANTGILLLLDMQGREWYMSTCGEAIYIFTDYSLDQLGETIVPWLSSGYYYDAFSAWLNALAPYVDAYRNGAPIDGYVQPDAYDSPYGDEIVHYGELSVANIFLISLLVGLVAAIITIFIMRSAMNTARLQSGAVDYLKDGTFRLRQRSDMYLYSRVSRTAKPKNNSSSGGGSSVHRSSGGVSHGGRGGRF